MKWIISKTIVRKNGKIVWKVACFEYYLQLLQIIVAIVTQESMIDDNLKR